MAKTIKYSDESVLMIHEELNRVGATTQINGLPYQSRAPRFDSRDQISGTCGQLGVGSSAARVVLVLHVVEVLISRINESIYARHPLHLCGGRNEFVHRLKGLQETMGDCPVLG